jgi:hypothetical protein
VLGLPKGSFQAIFAECPDGTVLVGGGARFNGDFPETVSITSAWPFAGPPSRYYADFSRIADADDFGGQRDVSVYAICASITVAG